MLNSTGILRIKPDVRFNLIKSSYNVLITKTLNFWVTAFHTFIFGCILGCGPHPGLLPCRVGGIRRG